MRAVARPVRGSAAGELIYAIGDVHGCYEPMKQLLATIARDYADRAFGRTPILVFLGDYVDRGPKSAQVLEALVWLRRRGEVELHLLKGNHEQALMAFIDEPATGADWLRFGGADTLASYGVQPPDPAIEGQAGLVRARDELLERMPASHLKLLQDLELMVTVGDYAFVHAGVRPGVALAAQSEDDLLWIRKGFVDAPGPFGGVIVHGHTWKGSEPEILDHRLGLDTGCYATGVLTALRLEDGEVEVMQAGLVAAEPA